MPNCFHLIRKSDPTNTPVKLRDIDAEIWTLFEQPVNEKHWCLDWYNWLGYGLAMGWSYEKIAEVYITPDREKDEEGKMRMSAYRKVLAYVKDNFNHEAWFEHK